MKRSLISVAAIALVLGGAAAEDLASLKSWAEQGDAEAQYLLGTSYFDGDGVTQDYAEAAKWVRRAADQGHAHSQFLLGSIYSVGERAPQDYREAAKWYLRAAEQGLARSQFTLGSLYTLGQGVPQSYVEAHKWFNLAAARGEPKAGELRNTVARIMTPEQIAEAQKLAREWEPKKE